MGLMALAYAACAGGALATRTPAWALRKKETEGSGDATTGPSKAKAIRHRVNDATRAGAAVRAKPTREEEPIPRSGAVANREPLRWDGTDGARRSVRNKFRGHNAHAVDTTYTRCTCSTEKLTAKATHAYGVEATRRRYAATLTRAVQSQRRGRTHTHAHACTHMLPARR